MSLQTRRPPGHAKRKALTYAADILGLRAQGHSYSAIREALEDAGLLSKERLLAGDIMPRFSDSGLEDADAIIDQ